MKRLVAVMATAVLVSLAPAVYAQAPAAGDKMMDKKDDKMMDKKVADAPIRNQVLLPTPDPGQRLGSRSAKLRCSRIHSFSG